MDDALFSRMEARRFLSLQPDPLVSGSGLRTSMVWEACTTRFGSNFGSPSMVLLPATRWLKLLTS